MIEQPETDASEALRERLERLERRLRRARSAQLQAEQIAEEGLRALYEKQEALNLLQRIATSANASNDLEETLACALEQICNYSHWDLGHVYFVAEQAPLRMVPGHISYLCSDADLSRFQATTAETDSCPAPACPAGCSHGAARLGSQTSPRTATFRGRPRRAQPA